MAFYLHIFPCLWLEFWFIVLYGEGCLDLKEEIGLVPATTYPGLIILILLLTPSNRLYASEILRW